MSVRVNTLEHVSHGVILQRQMVCSGTVTTCGVCSSRQSAEVLTVLQGGCDTGFYSRGGVVQQ